MRLVSQLLLLALAGNAQAEGFRLDPWTREDTYLQAAVTALLGVDWGQTLYISKHRCNIAGRGKPCYTETGFARHFIGENPTRGKVNNYFALSIVGHAAVSYLLPSGWRDAWQYVFIGIELDTIERNRSIGIKVDI